MTQTHADIAREKLLDGDEAKEVRIVRDEGSGATQIYLVALDCGWKQSILASGCYLKDALGIAHALAEVLDCEVVES